MLSIRDEMLHRVIVDFDMMLNATLERMKEHGEEKGEVTLKLTIEMKKDRIEIEDKVVVVDEPHISHKVKSKWSGGRDFEGAVTEQMYIIGKEKEDYQLIKKKDVQMSMFDDD